MENSQAKFKDLPTREKCVICVLLLSTMAQTMGTCAVAPAMPAMSAAFPQVSATIMQMVITLPGLALALLGVAVGAVADKLGKAPTFIVGSAVFTITGVAVALFNNMAPILVCRFLLGAGIACSMVANNAIVADRYHGPLRIRVLSLQSAAVGIGIFVLEQSGGILAGISWRAAFLIYLVGLLVFLGGIFFLLPAAKEPLPALPGNEEPVTHVADAPHIVNAKRVITITVVGACICGFFLQGFNFSVPSKLPYLVSALGGGSALGGFFLGCNGLATTAFSLLQAKLIVRFKRSSILFVGFLMLGGGLAGIGLGNSLVLSYLMALVAGFGQGLIFPTLLQWLSAVSTPQTSGKIMGVYNAVGYGAIFIVTLCIELVQAAAGSIAGVFIVFGCIVIVFSLLVFACKHLIELAR